MYYDGLRLSGYKGRIYLVNRKGGEFLGQKLYSSLIDLPETPDLVICCISASLIPGLVDECIAKGVKAMTIFTAGFSERNGAEGRTLEGEISGRARAGGVRLIGPNCLGPYCPEAGVSPGADYPREPGPAGLICQSGGNSIQFIRASAQRGVRLRYGISYGNACDVNECDLLEYMAADPGVKIIAMYVEGARNGRRFFSLLRKVTAEKPVVIQKAGRTVAGARAAASHSGSLAGESLVWDAMCRQSGAIQVNTMEELIDTVVTFLYFPSPGGRRVTVLGMTGGATVLATDDIAAGGLTVPPLPDRVKADLARFYNNDPGVITTNPIDVSVHGFVNGIYEPFKMVQNAAADFVMVHVPIGLFLLPQDVPEVGALKAVVADTIRLHKEGTRLPTQVVLYAMTAPETRLAVLDCQKDLYQAGLPVYNSILGAARAVDRMLTYFERRASR